MLVTSQLLLNALFGMMLFAVTEVRLFLAMTYEAMPFFATEICLSLDAMSEMMVFHTAELRTYGSSLVSEFGWAVH
jgi:hypothetical protein